MKKILIVSVIAGLLFSSNLYATISGTAGSNGITLTGGGDDNTIILDDGTSKETVKMTKGKYGCWLGTTKAGDTVTLCWSTSYHWLYGTWNGKPFNASIAHWKVS